MTHQKGGWTAKNPEIEEGIPRFEDSSFNGPEFTGSLNEQSLNSQNVDSLDLVEDDFDNASGAMEDDEEIDGV